MITVKRSWTPEQFAAKAAALKTSQGIELAGSSGKVSKLGVSGTYTYDGATLTVTITAKPMFAPWSLVVKDLNLWLDS